MKRPVDYTTEAQRLAQAIDFAIAAISKYPPKGWSQKEMDEFLEFYTETKENILNPKPRFKKLLSLKYSIEAVFTYFQESSGGDVEYFWKQIYDHDLGYTRKERLSGILKRGEIKNRNELEYATDILHIAQEENRVEGESVKRLREMIDEYAAKRVRR